MAIRNDGAPRSEGGSRGDAPTPPPRRRAGAKSASAAPPPGAPSRAPQPATKHPTSKKAARSVSGREAARRRSGQRSIADRYRLEGTYERLRRGLLEGPNDGRLDRALSYWVLPTDRRLPIAFLDRTLRELLSHPLGELMGTQGVGQKKTLGFFDLLRRALNSQTPHSPAPPPGATKSPSPAARRGVGVVFDPATVSEAVWSEWCETILRSGLHEQKLGRVAPSLHALPTVIWHKPLAEYASMPLAQIRTLKTHGEKRVNAILEVFHAVFEAVSTAVLAEELELDVVPRFVPRLTHWLIDTNHHPGVVTVEQLQDRVVRPLLAQVRVDLGEEVARLAEERLRVDGSSPSVKQQADRLGVTRARVYQLLDDCAKALEVRWPEGRWLLAPLAERPSDCDPAMLGLLHGVRALFFPTDRLIPADRPA